MASKRASIRRCSSARSTARKIFSAASGSRIAGMPSRCQSASERPVASSTSSARAIRMRSPGLSRSAIAGSRRASSACSAGGALGVAARPHRGADLGRRRRHRRQPLGQRLEVEPGAADQDRHAPCALGLVQRRAGILAPAPDRIVLGGIDMAIEPVRHPRLLRRARPRRDDAQIAIDLHGIGVDDDAADASRPRPAPAPTCRSRSGLRSGWCRAGSCHRS